MHSLLMPVELLNFKNKLVLPYRAITKREGSLIIENAGKILLDGFN